ncbi:MAG: membrane-bound lytic murein transglycosylase MltF [Gammaproteobacteria bacterium]|nr:membrane-bound lytic murein transglycosylase MltF [Gammaproteobacteria bacterium]
MRAFLVACVTAALTTCSQPPSLLDEILTTGALRVVTTVSPTTYYLGPNGPLGPEYELIRGFADYLGVELQMASLDRFADVLPSVVNGRAHVAAAGLTVTDERARRVVFGPRYQQVNQSLVYKFGHGKPREVTDLVGRRVEVGVGTSYVERLSRLQEREPRVVFTEHPRADEAELLLAVADGTIDYTVADSNVIAIYRNLAPEIRRGFDVATGDTLAWALPQRYDPTLQHAVERYFEEIRTNGQLNRIMDRYYGHTKRFDYVGTRRFMRDARNKLPRYRELFENAAANIDTDWRLLAAIGYQESHWDPEAVSPTGVKGIMMLTKLTASVIGVDDRVDPAQSIVGGAYYLDRLKRRLPADIKDPDRTWFALAAYNIGYEHVRDARKLTREEGLDDTLWVHVRDNLNKLAQRRWYERTKNGFAPGWDAVRYVENVRNYYDILRWLNWQDQRKSPDPDDTITLVSNDA